MNLPKIIDSCEEWNVSGLGIFTMGKLMKAELLSYAGLSFSVVAFTITLVCSIMLIRKAMNDKNVDRFDWPLETIIRQLVIAGSVALLTFFG